MRTPPLCRLPILPVLLHQLSRLATCLGMLGSAMKVCLTYAFFGMLRQSNLTLASLQQFNPSCHTCLGNIILASLGLLIIVRRSKIMQTVSRFQVLPIPEVPGHDTDTDPVAAYKALLAALPTTEVNKLLFTVTKGRTQQVVITFMLSQALKVSSQGPTVGQHNVLTP